MSLIINENIYFLSLHVRCFLLLNVLIFLYLIFSFFLTISINNYFLFIKNNKLKYIFITKSTKKNLRIFSLIYDKLFKYKIVNKIFKIKL